MAIQNTDPGGEVESLVGVRSDLISANFDSTAEFREWHLEFEHDPPASTLRLTQCNCCNTVYVVTPYAHRHSYFCGVDCRRRWYTRNYSDHDILDHINTRDESYTPDSVKANVRAETGHTCAHCGLPQDVVQLLTADSQRLNVHHIVKHDKFITTEAANHPTNLTPLDPACHGHADSAITDLDNAVDENDVLSFSNRQYLKKFLYSDDPPTPDELRNYDVERY